MRFSHAPTTALPQELKLSNELAKEIAVAKNFQRGILRLYDWKVNMSLNFKLYTLKHKSCNINGTLR